MSALSSSVLVTIILDNLRSRIFQPREGMKSYMDSIITNCIIIKDGLRLFKKYFYCWAGGMGCMLAMVHFWRPAKNFVEWVLAFHLGLSSAY